LSKRVLYRLVGGRPAAVAGADQRAVEFPAQGSPVGGAWVPAVAVRMDVPVAASVAAPDDVAAPEDVVPPPSHAAVAAAAMRRWLRR